MGALLVHGPYCNAMDVFTRACSQTHTWAEIEKSRRESVAAALRFSEFLVEWSRKEVCGT